MNVLIAEDDAVTRLMLQRALERDGHACLVAQHGLEAWPLVHVDAGMFMSGYEPCLGWERRPANANVPAPTQVHTVDILGALRTGVPWGFFYGPADAHPT